MSKSVFEADLDFDSVIIWEAGTGHRIFYDSRKRASIAYEWLIEKSNKFHEAKAENGVYVTQCYGEDVTPYECIRRFLIVAHKCGYRIEEASLQRPPSEFW